MRRSKRQQKAFEALNLDLFEPETLQVPSPATLYTRIREYAVASAENTVRQDPAFGVVVPAELPPVEELRRLFRHYNWLYFKGKLPETRIEYSNRMTSAGSYSPRLKLIKISRKYHEIFPEEVADTLKHEMLHIVNPHHDAAFKAEAARVGASVKARSHPSLRKPPRYVYVCPNCGLEYPRQKKLRQSSCGRCSKGGHYDERFKLRLKTPSRQPEVGVYS